MAGSSILGGRRAADVMLAVGFTSEPEGIAYGKCMQLVRITFATKLISNS